MSVEGLGPLLANLARIQGTVENVALDEGLKDAAALIHLAWVANIESEPLVLTGNYRDSIQINDSVPHWIAIYSDVEYAGILEYGDSRQAAHPVAERAFDEHHGDALGAVQRRIWTVVR